MDVQALLTHTKPEVVLLAQLVSPAARIEPELVRAMRLAFLPDAEPGIEADLWFSMLVETQTSEAIVLVPEIAAVLRGQLLERNHPVGLDPARRVIERVHRQSSASLRTEEELVYFGLVHDISSAGQQAHITAQIERIWQNVLGEMAQAAEQAQRVAYWAAGALPNLPPATQTPGFALVQLAASLLLDGRRIGNVNEMSAAPIEALQSFMPTGLAPVPTRVRLVPGRLELGGTPAQDEPKVELPDTSPLVVQVIWQSDNEVHKQLVTLKRGELKTVDLNASEFELHTVAGQRYLVRATIPQPVPETEQIEMQESAPVPRPEIQAPLSPEERANWKALDFRLVIERARTGYQIRVESSPAGGGSAQWIGPSDDLKERLETLAKVPRGEKIPLPAIREVGMRLFDAVFRDKVLDTYRWSQHEAQGKDAPLRLSFRFWDADELEALPWEMIYDAEQEQFLALSAQSALIRSETVATPRPALPVAGALRVLFLQSFDTDRARDEMEGEWRQLQDALAPHIQNGAIVLERIARPTRAVLAKRLAEQTYHILHLAGRADMNLSDYLSFHLEDEQGKPDAIGLPELGKRLADHAALRVAVFTADVGVQLGWRDPDLDSAQHLGHLRVPAVVTMRFSIPRPLLTNFAVEFYRALAEGASLDLAVGEARKAIYQTGAGYEWAAPALYTFATDETLLDVSPRIVVEPKETAPPTAGRRAEPIKMKRQVALVTRSDLDPAIDQQRALQAVADALRARAQEMEKLGRVNLLELVENPPVPNNPTSQQERVPQENQYQSAP